MNVGGRGGPKAEINVTPLVDVVLVLLIIFMVVTPMMQRGKSVKLPQATSVSEEGTDKPDPLILSVTPDKKTYLESDLYPDAVALQSRLAKELREQPRRRILLKADEALSYGDVRKVMELARSAGAKGMAIGVEQRKNP
jgi:biopolymer transport protein ExbD